MRDCTVSANLVGVALGRRERGAAVDYERMARDVARVVRQQEAHGMADVPAGALDAERRGLAAAVARGVEVRKDRLFFLSSRRLPYSSTGSLACTDATRGPGRG